MNLKTKGILYVITAAFGFSAMSVFVHLAGDIPTLQKAFFRNFVALVFVAAVMAKNKISPVPKRQNLLHLFLRAAFGTVGLVANFYAIDRLVLADANMLNKLSPFFAVVFSAFILKERPTGFQICGVAVALCGCVLIIKPSLGGYASLPAAIGMLGGMSAGVAYTFVRRLGQKGENSFRIIFFFSAFSCIVCLPFMFFGFSAIPPRSFVFLVLAGLSASLGQFGITRAYLCAPAKEISVYDYTQVLFAALFGFFVFGQKPDFLSVAGYVLICGAGIAMFFYNKNKND